MTARVGERPDPQRIADVLSGNFGKSALSRSAVRLIIEEALAAEVTDVLLGRGYYERGEPVGYRNGSRLGRLKTAEGIVEFAVPQVTGAVEPWASGIRQALSGRTEELERLVVEMYARGLSICDIEAAFTGADGRCVLTKSAASQVAERLWEGYSSFAGRALSGQPILCLFLDGVAERLHLGQPREPVLATWGIATTGAKVLLGLYSASKEDAARARECLRDLNTWRMNDPVLIATDGVPGLIRAVEEVFPQSLRRRCLAHKLLNLGAKVLEERWRESRPTPWSPTRPSRRWRRAPPPKSSGAGTFGSSPARSRASRTTSMPVSPAYLRLPIAHRKAIRTTNLLERLFGEERRRTKIIPHAFGESGRC